MRYAIGILMVVLGVMVVGAFGDVGASQPATRGASATSQADVRAENEKLRAEVAELKKQVEALTAENAKLKKQWNEAVRNGTGDVTTKTQSTPRTTKTTDGGGKAGAGVGGAAVEQDGPGLYRVSAGPGGKYTGTVRAKSREDAISKGLSTVGQKAMDFDENVEVGTLKVEKIGP